MLKTTMSHRTVTPPQGIVYDGDWWKKLPGMFMPATGAWKDVVPTPEHLGEMFANWTKLALLLEKEMGWWAGTIEWELVTICGTCPIRGNPGGEYQLETAARISIRIGDKPGDVLYAGTAIPFRDNWGHGQDSDEQAMQQAAYQLKKRHDEIEAYCASHPLVSVS